MKKIFHCLTISLNQTIEKSVEDDVNINNNVGDKEEVIFVIFIVDNND